MPILTVAYGDITEQEVQAVVNAANNAMRGGGGVDGAIHRAGGRAILEDCIARFPDGLATGDAGYTTGGNLHAQWVIHTVGPNYRAGERDRALLESCYQRALKVADELGARSVAFPLISAGSYGWPLDDAIAVAIEVISTAGTRVETATLVAGDAAAYTQLSDQLRAYKSRRPPLGQSMELERARLRHDWDPAPYTDSSRFIVRDRTDGEPGVNVVIADSDTDYRTYHLGPSEIEIVIDALSRSTPRRDG